LFESIKGPDDPANALWDDMSAALSDVPFLTLAIIDGPCIGGGNEGHRKIQGGTTPG
jgi:hypothetical protein